VPPPPIPCPRCRARSQVPPARSPPLGAGGCRNVPDGSNRSSRDPMPLPVTATPNAFAPAPTAVKTRTSVGNQTGATMRIVAVVPSMLDVRSTRTGMACDPLMQSERNRPLPALTLDGECAEGGGDEDSDQPPPRNVEECAHAWRRVPSQVPRYLRQRDRVVARSLIEMASMPRRWVVSAFRTDVALWMILIPSFLRPRPGCDLRSRRARSPRRPSP
jgi:hypothetical protein